MLNIYKRLILGVGLTLTLLNACHRSNSAGTSTTKDGVPEAKIVTLFAWADYFNPAVLKDFETQTGVKVDYQTFSSAEEMEARLRSTPAAFDLIVIDSFNLPHLHQLSLIAPLDKARLPGLSNLDPGFLNLSFDPHNEYSVPYTWGTTLIAYRTDKLPQPDRSWNLLFDKKLSGHVMMIDDNFDALASSMLSLGKSPSSRIQADYDAAVVRLVDQISTMNVIYGDDSTIKAALVAGDTWAAMCYSGDASTAAEEQPLVDFFIPKEGAPKWVDSFAVTRDARHAGAAHEFVNFLLDPAVSAKNSIVTRYATPNLKAKDHLPAEFLADERIFPPADIMVRCVFLPKMDAANAPMINRAWLAVQRAYMAAHEKTAQPRPVLGAAATVPVVPAGR